MEGTRKAFDRALDILIVLAIIAAMAEDAADAALAPMALRYSFALANTLFDAFFTFEFALRFASAASENRIAGYMGNGLGWVDLLSSIALLVFVSGPFAFGFLEGGPISGGALSTAGFLGPLRSLRALRLLRFVRLLGRIKGFDSLLTRRHVAKAATLGMGAVIAAFLVLAIAASAGIFPGAAEPRVRSFASLYATIAALAVAAAIVFVYGPYFARGVGAPVVAALRWASGEDTRVRVLAPQGRADEETFLLSELLDDRAIIESHGHGDGGSAPVMDAPTTKAEIEGLLSRASAFSSIDGGFGLDAYRPSQG